MQEVSTSIFQINKGYDRSFLWWDCGFFIGCVDHFEKNNRSNSSCAKGRKLAVIKGGETDAGLYVLADFKGGLEIRVSGQEELKMVQ